MICDDERDLHFYLGSHRANWITTAPDDVSLFLSHRVLREYKTLPKLPEWPAGRHIAIDSGAFTELNLYHQFVTPPDEYIRALVRYDDEITDLDWAAPQDWMCEPWMLAKTGLTIREHQRRTVENFLLLTELWDKYGTHPECPVMPVIQGWTVDDYLACVALYEENGVRLAEDYPIVGVGSVCRRQGSQEIGDIFRTLAGLDLPLHGFGVKLAGIRKYGRYLVTADSMAWSYAGRRTPTQCGSTTHKSEANCQAFALQWRDRIEEAAIAAKREIYTPDQLDLFPTPARAAKQRAPKPGHQVNSNLLGQSDQLDLFLAA
ncbi:deazapurine DNA modification protein DpdA family protein [Nonomuraea sp. NPDC003707]